MAWCEARSQSVIEGHIDKVNSTVIMIFAKFRQVNTSAATYARVRFVQALIFPQVDLELRTQNSETVYLTQNINKVQ